MKMIMFQFSSTILFILNLVVLSLLLSTPAPSNYLVTGHAVTHKDLPRKAANQSLPPPAPTSPLFLARCMILSNIRSIQLLSFHKSVLLVLASISL